MTLVSHGLSLGEVTFVRVLDFVGDAVALLHFLPRRGNPCDLGARCKFAHLAVDPALSRYLFKRGGQECRHLVGLTPVKLVLGLDVLRVNCVLRLRLDGSDATEKGVDGHNRRRSRLHNYSKKRLARPVREGVRPQRGQGGRSQSSKGITLTRTESILLTRGHRNGRVSCIPSYLPSEYPPSTRTPGNGDLELLTLPRGSRWSWR